MACSTITTASQKSQKAIKPWDGLVIDLFDQINLLKTDLKQGRKQGRELAKQIIFGYFLANLGESRDLTSFCLLIFVRIIDFWMTNNKF